VGKIYKLKKKYITFKYITFYCSTDAKMYLCTYGRRRDMKCIFALTEKGEV